MSEREEIAHLLKGSRRFYSAYLHLLLGGKKIEDKWKQDLSVRDWLKGTHHLDAKGNGHRTCNSDQDCEVFIFLVGPLPVEPSFSAMNIANIGGKSSRIAKVLILKEAGFSKFWGFLDCLFLQLAKNVM